MSRKCKLMNANKFSATRGGTPGGPLQEGDNDRRQEHGQHGHRLEDPADQRGRRGTREEGLGVDEAEGAERR